MNPAPMAFSAQISGASAGDGMQTIWQADDTTMATHPYQINIPKELPFVWVAEKRAPGYAMAGRKVISPFLI